MSARQSLPLHSAAGTPHSALRPPHSVLVDTFGRVHNNLRISVTDRCNLRCTYCMAEEVVFMDRSALLTFEEIAHFVRVAAPLGIDKVRLTGGEPLMRKNLDRLVRMVVEVPGIKDVGLTTNGLLLAEHAQELYDAGLRRINISLDTLDAGRFRTISRREGLEQVLEGIAAAKKAGFDPIKVNAVIIRGVNDMDVVPLANFAADTDWRCATSNTCRSALRRGSATRSTSPMRSWSRSSTRSLRYLRPRITIRALPAMEFRYADGRGTVGMIASISRPFCLSCNRVRLTSDGKVRNCLFALDEVDVKPLLRGTPDDTRLAELIRRNVWDKWEGHEINTARFVKPQRTMHAIGG